MRTLRIAVSVLAALALAACGQPEPTPSTSPEGAPVASSAQPEPTGPPASDPTASDPATSGAAPGRTTPPAVPPPTRGAPPPGSPTTLTGVVRQGVEVGCYLIDDYLLVGGPRDVITAGGRLTVTGRVQPDLMTTCQQGIPFVVESATRG